MPGHATCEKCYRSSPPVKDLVELRALGWQLRPDGARVCPICSARVSTLPPPPSNESAQPR